MLKAIVADQDLDVWVLKNVLAEKRSTARDEARDGGPDDGIWVAATSRLRASRDHKAEFQAGAGTGTRVARAA